MSVLRQIAHSAWVIVATIAPALMPSRCPAQDDGPETHDLSPFRACGLNCLFVVAKLNGVDASLKSLEREVAPRANGESSIADLERASKKLGLDPTSVRVGMDALGTIPLPAIVQLKSRARQSDASHYVVLVGLHRRGVMLIDPPAGATLHPFAEFADDWTGVTVAFAGDRARKDQFLSEMGKREWRTIWPARLAIVASLSGLAWFLFAKKNVREPRREPAPTRAGVDP